MRDLNAEELLNVWEQGINQPMLQKSLVLLAAAFPEKSVNRLAELSIGSRDTCLFLLRERLFGSRLVNNAVCPACAEKIEWEQDIAEMVKGSPDFTSHHQYMLEQGGYRLSFRPPNSIDMASIEDIGDAEIALTQLLARCIQSADYAGGVCTIDDLPESIIQTVNQQIEELDPQAEIRINLTCPECSHRWEVFFDISSFLWTEIDEWAVRMLQTVHKLARAYGWSEQDILNLSPVRRQLYLGMVGI